VKYVGIVNNKFSRCGKLGFIIICFVSFFKCFTGAILKS